MLDRVLGGSVNGILNWKVVDKNYSPALLKCSRAEYYSECWDKRIILEDNPSFWKAIFIHRFIDPSLASQDPLASSPATMRFSAVSGLALATVAATGASAMSAKMETLRSVKQDQWAQMRDEGAFDEDQYRAMAVTKCVNGKAGEYSCNNVDMMAFLSHQDMGSRTRMGNDIWGMCQD